MNVNSGSVMVLWMVFWLPQVKMRDWE